MTPSLDELFDVFWAVYPRRVAKKAARVAFARLNPTPALVERMVSALEAQARQPQWTRGGGQYIPHPATWLNGERWEDEVTPAIAGMSRRTAALVDASQRFLRDA